MRLFVLCSNRNRIRSKNILQYLSMKEMNGGKKDDRSESNFISITANTGNNVTASKLKFGYPIFMCLILLETISFL